MKRDSDCFRSRPATALLSMVVMAWSTVLAEQPTPLARDEHAAHRESMRETIRVTDAEYLVPDVTLQSDDGRSLRLRDLLAPDRRVAVNFIFTSCTTICPVMTATTLELQRTLAAAGDAPEFISISIDPQFDSAAVLRAYAARHGAQWKFLTGSSEDVTTVLRAFDAWRGSKGNHAALTLFHRADEPHWTRVEGLASAQSLAAIWRKTS